MKLRRLISSLLILAVMLSSVSFAVSAAVVDVAQTEYYNQSHLEDYAQKAKNEKGLGVSYTKDATTFKVWSPTATAVMVKLYSTGTDAESGAAVLGTHAMQKNATTGVWSLTLKGDYKDVYYTYLLTIDGSTTETQDPYATAVGANGERSMVVDLDSTDPEGWDEDNHVLFDSAAEASVWEIHVRDFSISPSSGVSDEYKGKYLAFTEGNTTINGEGDIATCVDYLVEQGINCIQLLPIADFSGIDETNSDPQRNWGYNPVNFNVPDGAYATDCYDGNARIKEFKQLIQACHDRGIAVVMDVVYNHTYVLEGSALARTVPKYYHRMSDSQNYYNGSGLGNCLSTEKAMTSKYVVESLKYWVEEYHVDGFRFDLMGALDCDTLNAARAELDKIDTRLLMWGEPWAGGDAGISNGATNGNFSKLNDRIGGFNQTYSKYLKGDESMHTSTVGEFVQGDSTNAAILSAAKGTATYFNTSAISKVLNYPDNHDNLTLYDKLLRTNQDELGYRFTVNKDMENLYKVNSTVANTYYPEVSDQIRLALVSIMTAQGIPFFNAGTEFARSKFGDANSYRTSDNINAIDWTRLEQWGGDADYYAGLLKIRKAFAPFSDNKADTISTISTQNPIAYTINNTKAGQWSKAVVIMNNSKNASKTVNLPSGTWTVVANDKKAGLDSLGTATGTYTVPARSGAILVQGSCTKPAEGFATLTAEHYVRDSASGSYTLAKTNSAKYAVGQTYRAITDTNILFDHNLDSFESSTGALSGKATAGLNVKVKFYYTRFTESNYLTVKFLDSTTGERVRPHIQYRLHDGAKFSIPATGVQGYSLDTAKYPAGTVGTFDASAPLEFNYYYNELTHTQTVVHFYNSHPNWNNAIIQCYAYYDTSTEEPLGPWTDNTAGNMAKDPSLGDNWYTVTIPNVKSCRVMFHPKNAVSGVQQEPGQGETGYEVSGEAWIKDKTLTFSCSVVTSYIDLATGKQLAPDTKKDYAKITSNGMYSTSPDKTLGGYLTPANASNFFKAGITNVVYLYDGTTPPGPTPGGSYKIGDTDLDKTITVLDATLIQMDLADIKKLSEDNLKAAHTDDDEKLTVLDATNIQRFLAEITPFGHVGEKVGEDAPEEGEHSFAELIEMYNTLSAKYIALPADVYKEDEGYKAAGIALDTYKSVTLNPSAEPELIDEAYEAFAAAYEVIKDYDENVEPPKPDTLDIYFSNNKFWSTVNYYAWGTGGNMSWPGSPMEFVKTNEMGESIYKVTIDPSQYQNIIFNNGSAQTVDIALDLTKTNVGYYITSDSGKLTVGTYDYVG